MKTGKSNPTLVPSRPEQAPQVKVRSGLRSGASLEACEKSLQDWKRNYYKWYEVAKYKSV